MRLHTLSDGAHGANVLRLQQPLAKWGYLPVSFQAHGGAQPPYVSSPRRCTSGAPLAVAGRGFRNGHARCRDVGRRVWLTLLGKRPAKLAPYSFALVREASPETITVYQTGRRPFSSPANTGMSVAPTALATCPVYVRYTSTTMQGTNPDGTHYDDPRVPWVSYVNGGDAVHGFLRSSDGSPQSLGCVELPHAAAEVAYGLMNYGTLVTVT